MKIYTVAEIQTKLQETELYKSIRPTSKKLLLDKCNVLLHFIIVNNIYKNKWDVYNYSDIHLHSDLLKTMLGKRYYKAIIHTLIEVGLVEVDDSFISATYINMLNYKRSRIGLHKLSISPASKKYGLTSLAKRHGVEKVEINSKKIVKKMIGHKTEVLGAYLSDPIHRKIIKSTMDLYFDPPFIFDEVKEITGKVLNEQAIKYYKNVYESLLAINKYNTIKEYQECENYYYTHSKKVGRVFHTYSSIPKLYRKHLVHIDGSSLMEIDLKNSQPLLLSLKYLEETKNKTAIFKDVVGGNFYKKVQEMAKSLGYDDLSNLYFDNYSKFKSRVLGQGLYFRNLPLKSIKHSENCLLQLYPDFMKWLRETKGRFGYKYISYQGQRLESGIFIRDIFQEITDGTFCVPIHDSLIIKTQNKVYFEGILKSIFKKRFPFLTGEQITGFLNIKTLENEKIN